MNDPVLIRRTASVARPRFLNRHIALTAAAFLVSASALLLETSSYAASPISGTVFRDIDANGATSTPEPGVASVRVRAFDAAGSEVASVVTDGQGRYSINPTGTGPWRVEFDSIPTGFVFGPRTSDLDGTAVRRVWPGAGSEDLALVRPGETCQAKPELAVTCFASGHYQGTSAGDRAVAVFSSTADGSYDEADWSAPPAKYLHRQTGTTYGVAWQPSSDSLFTSAYLRRFAGLGPGGIGGIYRNGAVALDLAAVPGMNSLGTDPHPSTAAGDWKHDAPAWPKIGAEGLGDLDITLDGRSLITVNLASKQLVTIPVSRNGTIPSGMRAAATDAKPAANEIGQFAIPSAACPDPSTWRPFGLGLRGPTILVGATCFSNLHGVVLPFDSETATWGAPLLDIDLSFPRGRNGFERMWEGWRDNETKVWNRPQLLVSDLVMDRGDLVIALRDRYGDQTGYNAYTTDVGSKDTYSTGVLGDILRACIDSSGTFVLESNGRCGAIATPGTANNDGPGGGEYYSRDDFLNEGKISDASPHANAGEGSLALLPMENRIANTHMDPKNYWTSGVVTYGNDNGLRTTSYEVTVTAKGHSGPFGKANSLGDLEALCDEAPLEIGNYVWLDSNANGVQDPNENGIADVVVELLAPDGGIVASATTDSDGHYLFSTAPGSSTASSKRGVIVDPSRKGYRVRVTVGQTPLNGLTVTKNEAAGTVGTGRDSDGVLEAGRSLSPAFTMPLPGTGAHTYDFGFTYVDPSKQGPSTPRPPGTTTTTRPPTTTKAPPKTTTTTRKPTTPTRSPTTTAKPAELSPESTTSTSSTSSMPPGVPTTTRFITADPATPVPAADAPPVVTSRSSSTSSSDVVFERPPVDPPQLLVPLAEVPIALPVPPPHIATAELAFTG